MKDKIYCIGPPPCPKLEEIGLEKRIFRLFDNASKQLSNRTRQFIKEIDIPTKIASDKLDKKYEKDIEKIFNNLEKNYDNLLKSGEYKKIFLDEQFEVGKSWIVHYILSLGENISKI